MNRMNYQKKIFIKVVFIFILLFYSVMSKAEGTIILNASDVSVSKDFEKKTIFFFPYTQNLPKNILITGFYGYLSTETLKSENVNSETLFGLSYSKTSNCPSDSHIVNGYTEYNLIYPNQGLAGFIVKQNKSGVALLRLEIKLNNGVPIKPIKGGCFMLSFDGTDFVSKPYTKKATIVLTYRAVTDITTSVRMAGLDSEYIASTNDNFSRVLNSYTVFPVSKNGDLRPGYLVDFYGNISGTPGNSIFNLSISKRIWSLKYIASIYKNGFCQKAFKNHPKGKFTWNDQTLGYGKANPTSIYAKDSFVFFNTAIGSKSGYPSIIGISAKIPKKIKLNDGDCIVTASIPNTQKNGTTEAINVENQIAAVITDK
ncbi:MAG: hypothetical protein ABF983_08735 [Acetobacter indonesiensis]